MFWGLILKANRKYTQTIKQAFHLSQAALDINNCSDEPVQVLLTCDSHNYILCTLRKDKVEQVALNLDFAEGDEISFISQGNGSVHLSGTLVPDELDLLGEEESESEETENHVPGKKQAKVSKVLKKVALQNDDEDDEDEDDSDFNGSAEEDDDEEGEDDEEEDDDEADSDSADEVVEPKPKQMKLDKGKQNLENGKALSNEKSKKEKKKEQKSQQQNKSPKSGEKTIQGGVKIEDVKVGGGNEAKPGKKVQVYYEGKLKSNNKIFDSSKSGNGFKFSLGKGEVIKGWDIGVAGMKVGGKRRITCPPHMAYGQKGSPPVIPPNSTLVFEVELKNVF